MATAAYDWRFTDELGMFLERAEGFLRSEPALHTVQLTIANALRTRGTTAYGEKPPHFAWLADLSGTVRATAVRTPPHGLSLTAAASEALGALAERLADEGHALPGVFGPADTAAEFAAAWERRTGDVAQLAMNQRLYRLGTLTPPEPMPPGAPRVATGDDYELVARWHDEFGEALGGQARQPSDAWTESRLAYGGVTLWETPDGTPVAMAGATPMVAGQVRVAPVYTPAHLRGRGYGGAATTEVGRTALAAGADEVVLFTDLANPVSNGLYQRIGYRPVRDFATYTFRTAAPAAPAPAATATTAP
jgi:RimJ/RimL family protein N-acetyltransferase